ncbi:hypothetical protein [Phenylobacterium sp.]|uniref:hypothetical protein n=1 Tax=Phenylobacterium sp. TaxID=1871053 RepID=UPI0026062238|nr:hypothetical protein [Phenylobacterium sp.]
MRPQTEAKLATFFAKPEWPEIRSLLCSMGHGKAVADIDLITKRVRRNLWKDFTPSPSESSSEPSDA